MSYTKRILYIVLGTVCLVVGTIGIFVPLLPTTPLWLLTCWFYLRSSEKLYNRVMRNRYFGGYIKGFMVDKAIPVRSKVISLSVMWVSMIVTCLFLVKLWWVHALLFVISAAVTWHILSFPTRKEE